MTIGDLVFLFSALAVIALLIATLGAALLGRFKAALRFTRLLGFFAAAYGLVLISAALLRPRHIYGAGQTRCFDDWCITAKETRLNPNGHTWTATFEVSSVAKRVRQRATDAHAELEDSSGRRYRPIASTSDQRKLSDELGPGESFPVSLAFELPAGVEPGGAIIHHGDFPGVVIIGADQSCLHAPALLQFAKVRGQ